MTAGAFTNGTLRAGDPDEETYLARFAESGAQARDAYDPLEAVPGVCAQALPPPAGPRLSIAVLERARDYAFANNSSALIVWHDGIEAAYYAPGVNRDTLLNSRSMAKPLAAVAIGRAIAGGAIASLDQSAADFIHEWRGTPKAGIAVRHLLDMRSGLLAQSHSADPGNVWSRAYLHPRHERIMVEDYPLTARPGSRYQYSNVSGDLVALIIERATRRRYAEFVSTEIIKPLGAAGGSVWVDRPGGLAHSGCCMLLPAETWLRLGLLLLEDGLWQGRRLLPPGYVVAMRTPTDANPRFGLGVWVQGEFLERRGFGSAEQPFGEVLQSEPFLASDLFFFDGNANQVLYLVPSHRLAILRMGAAPPKSPEWDNAILPNLLLRDPSVR